MAKRKSARSKQLTKPDAALLAAIRESDVRRLRAALEEGANPSAEDENGPALSQAAYDQVHGEEMVMALVAAGADVAPLRDALGWAVSVHNGELVRKLIAAGVDVNRVSMSGTLLEIAARGGYKEIVDALIEAGADVNAGAPLVAAIKDGHSRIALALIQAGAKVNVPPSVSNVSPLAQAVARNDVAVLRLLIEKGADLNQPSKASFTDEAAGKLAVATPPPPGVPQAWVDALEKMRNTTIVTGAPLTLAALCGHAEPARLLIEAGADPHCKDAEGLTPYECATRKGHTAVAEALRAAGGEQRHDTLDEQLLAAAESNNVEEVRRLIGAGAAIEARDARKTTSGRTPLMLAAGQAVGSKQPKLLRVVSRLIELGADVNAGRPGLGAPLHSAVVYRNIDAAKLLLEHGADVQAKNEEGQTILQFARKFYDKPDKEDEQFLELLESYAGKAVVALPAQAPPRGKIPPGKKPPGKASAETKSTEAAWKAEEAPLPDLSKGARSNKYLAALEELERLCGTKRQPWDGVDGAFSFHVPVGREVDVASLQERLLKDGAYIVALDFSSAAMPPQRLLCFPTTDKYDAVAAMQTAGPNYELATGGILHWLSETEKKQPFILTGIGGDCLAGEFTTGIRDAKNLARRMIEFCPGIEDGFDEEADFAEDLGNSRRFSFWWD